MFKGGHACNTWPLLAEFVCHSSVGVYVDDDDVDANPVIGILIIIETRLWWLLRVKIIIKATFDQEI